MEAIVISRLDKEKKKQKNKDRVLIAEIHARLTNKLAYMVEKH